jgi:phosphoglycolate phosphatase-like HAD superfamily hydrolase
MARMGIQHLFEARVTAEDGTETIAESLLSAAYKLQRPPNQCVVFDGSPSGIAAAHNCTMKVRHCGWHLCPIRFCSLETFMQQDPVHNEFAGIGLLCTYSSCCCAWCDAVRFAGCQNA